MIAAHHSAMGGRGLSTLDYVQDAAFLFFDGIENAGRKTHDASATSWANLGTAGGAAAASASLAGSWKDDAFAFAEDGGFVYDLASLTWPSGPVSIEMAFRISQFGTWAGRIFGSKHSTTNARICFYPRNASGAGADLVWGWDAATSIQLDGGEALPKYYTLAIVASTSTYGGFYRWNFGTTSFSTSYRPNVKALNFTIGNEGDFARPLLGDVCAFRFHSRALSEDEIDFNAALDRKRFGVT